MADVNHVRPPAGRRRSHAAHLRRLARPTEKDAEFEPCGPGPDEEMAHGAREDDRVMRRVDSLLAEFRRGLPEALPCRAKILRQLFRQCGFRRRPAIVRRAWLNPLLAVVALPPGPFC